MLSGKRGFWQVACVSFEMTAHEPTCVPKRQAGAPKLRKTVPVIATEAWRL